MKLLDKIKSFFSKIKKIKKSDDLKMLSWEEEYYSENKEKFKSSIIVNDRELINPSNLNSKNWIKNILMYLGVSDEIANNPIVLKKVDEFFERKFEDVCAYSNCKKGDFSDVLELIELLKDEENVFYNNGLVISKTNDWETDILEIKKIEEGIRVSEQHNDSSKMGTTTINESEVYNSFNILMKKQKSTFFYDIFNNEDDYTEERNFARDKHNPFLIYEHLIKNKKLVNKRTDEFKMYYYKDYISKTCIKLDEIEEEEKQKVVFKKSKQGIKEFCKEAALHASNIIRDADADLDKNEEVQMFYKYCRAMLSELSK